MRSNKEKQCGINQKHLTHDQMKAGTGQRELAG